MFVYVALFKCKRKKKKEKKMIVTRDKPPSRPVAGIVVLSEVGVIERSRFSFVYRNNKISHSIR